MKKFHQYSLSYGQSGGMTVTSTGDLAIVEWDGIRVGIFTTRGRHVHTLTVRRASNLWGIARNDQILFITDNTTKCIHVIIESNFYVAKMYTGLTRMYGLDDTNHTIWVASMELGLYELTFDEQYNITASIRLVPSVEGSQPGSQFYQPTSVTAVQSGIIVSGYGSHNIHYLSYNGSMLYPPVGLSDFGAGQLYYPAYVITDGCGTVYVSDVNNHRIDVFTATGRFISDLASKRDGLLKPLSLCIHHNSLYITNRYTWNSPRDSLLWI